jgi:antitoxin HicB
MLKFPVVLTPAEEGGFVVPFPDIPEAITQGESEDDALLHARDALETALEMYVEDRRSLPRPSAKGKRFVSPGPMECVKLGIYQAMRDQRVTKSELARRLGVHPPQVDRLLDLRHHSRMDLVEAALAALGMRLLVDVQKAA